MNPLSVVPASSMLLVALGGACGCMARFAAINLVSRLNPSQFPLGTMIVNIAGSLLIGILLAKYGNEPSIRAFFVSGLLGGFTTFSAFSWDALQLLQRGQWLEATVYIGGSVALSLAAVTFGWQMVRVA